MMIKKFVTVAALFGAMALGGCATSGVLPGIGVNTTPGNVLASNADVEAGILAVRAQAVKLCAFQPTVATVSNLVASIGNVFVPGIGLVATTVNSIAGSICGAVTAKSVRRGGSLPSVRGVPIKGRFVG
jgi:hypothetical protein